MIMNYEKAYKEALERAKELHDKHPLGEPPTWTVCEQIFPELRESEDERIREAILHLVKHSGIATYDGINQLDMVVWLENQGEQKPVESSIGIVKITQSILDYINGKPSFSDIPIVLGEYWQVDEIVTYQNVNNGEPVVELSKKDGSWIRLPKKLVDIKYFNSNNIKQETIKWSEYDEKMLSSTIEYLNKFREVFEEGAQKCITWLELFKDRVQQQPQQKLSEVDEIALNDAIVALSMYANGEIPYILPSQLLEDVEQLKSLKNRIQPQSKQEWSEEDEMMQKKAVSIVKQYDLICKKEGDKCWTADSVIDWLKSLKPNHWKPSEYDISLLEEIARNIRNNVRPFCSEVSSLEDLVENLKKL